MPEAKKEERVVVTLKEVGEKKYRAISQAVAGTPPQLPLNLDSYAPDISIAGLKPEVRAEIESIITGKE